MYTLPQGALQVTMIAGSAEAVVGENHALPEPVYSVVQHPPGAAMARPLASRNHSGAADRSTGARVGVRE
jgi:hypothetical protein